jgi:hypothetical protein
MTNQLKTQLPANAANPRTITGARKERLLSSMKFLGDLGGIIFNERTKSLVGGHQRVESLSRDTSAKIEIVQRHDKPDITGTVATGFVTSFGTRFAYRVVNWDVETEKVAMIAANQHGGAFDVGKLANLLKDIETEGLLDVQMTGFEGDELRALVDGLNAPSNASAPAATKGKKSDRIHMTKTAREWLDKCKAALNETDDSVAIERVCKSFLL